MADRVELKKIRQVGLAELQDLTKAGIVKNKAPEFAPIPMFLPTRTFGRNIANVSTRQSFLNQGIGTWVMWRVMLVATILSAIAAVFLLFVNGYLAAAAGLFAGYAYGEYVVKGFTINNLFKGRRLLEST